MIKEGVFFSLPGWKVMILWRPAAAKHKERATPLTSSLETNSLHDVFTHLIMTSLQKHQSSKRRLPDKCWHHPVMSCSDNSWPCSGLKGLRSVKQTSRGPTQTRVTSTQPGHIAHPNPYTVRPPRPRAQPRTHSIVLKSETSPCTSGQITLRARCVYGMCVCSNVVSVV